MKRPSGPPEPSTGVGSDPCPPPAGSSAGRTCMACDSGLRRTALQGILLSESSRSQMTTRVRSVSKKRPEQADPQRWTADCGGRAVPAEALGLPLRQRENARSQGQICARRGLPASIGLPRGAPARTPARPRLRRPPAARASPASFIHSPTHLRLRLAWRSRGGRVAPSSWSPQSCLQGPGLFSFHCVLRPGRTGRPWVSVLLLGARRSGDTDHLRGVLGLLLGRGARPGMPCSEIT